MSDDPTKVRNQPALTRGPGNSWLLIGAAITLLSAVFFLLQLDSHPVGLALTGALVVVALYVCMLIVRFTIPGDRVRLGTLAVLLLLIAAVALIGLGVIAWTEWVSVT
ncbi:hypothetical protein [Cryobacterium tepidiphilum]|uniref:Uncharacterized protein n=1 Tax=Cryobacterium tepidiphilum TaxID=2486026 RepID=A0A3M8LP80_9MICO|nr:hypothetical protein [Cryobacterium tepidiphilum]RNE67293.1 hypothetical protein EEJ31_00475 [Cryobacterium tepidiphilum]